MSEQFKVFLSQLSETNATLGYFTEFSKVKDNVKSISIKLTQLNYLLGKENLQEAVHELYQENPKTFDVLDILIAIRKNKKAKVIKSNGGTVLLDSYFTSPQGIVEYIEGTGLADIFRNKDITNLVDYVFGIEVGLDSNARKNRGGDSMAKTVASIFDNNNIQYTREVSSTNFPDITSLGADIKRFDFVIKTRIKTYLLETNYYNGGGSKLNETARAYSDVAPKINQHHGFEFVWITDGQGWLSAKNKLEEAYHIIPSLYNLTTIKDFVRKVQVEGVIPNKG